MLPERRRTPTRMTQASLMNWVKKVFSNYLRSNGIDFFQVLINEFPRKIFHSDLNKSGLTLYSLFQNLGGLRRKLKN
jgi:hypothetical protein